MVALADWQLEKGGDDLSLMQYKGKAARRAVVHHANEL